MAIEGLSAKVYQATRNQSNSTELSGDQSKKLDEILGKYDAKNFTEEDAANLKSELETSGIKPGEGVKNKLTKSGFNSELLRPEGQSGGPSVDGNRRSGPGGSGRPGQGGPGGPGGPGGSGRPARGTRETSSESDSTMLNVEVLKPLKQTLQQFDLNNLTGQDQQSLVEKLRSQGILQTGLMIDLSA
ncbi:MAG: hypothetical protein AB1403_01565 [Candidatus Riflebacteria bacterium]